MDLPPSRYPPYGGGIDVDSGGGSGGGLGGDEMTMDLESYLMELFQNQSNSDGHGIAHDVPRSQPSRKMSPQDIQ